MNAPIQPKAPILPPILRWFMLAMVLANIAGSMMPLLMPIYLTQLGASVGQVGLVFTLSSVAILVLQIFGGYLSDSMGRLKAVAIGSVGGIIGLLAITLAPTWQWMIIALMVYQIPFAVVGPSFSAIIAENSSPENRGKVYGITGTIYSVTGVLGPPLGGFLAGAYGFKIMLLVATLLYSTAAVVRIWMARSALGASSVSARPAQPGGISMAAFKTSASSMLGMLLAGGVITWIFLVDGISDVAFRLSGELQPLYLEQVGGISIEQIGILGSINAIAGMFVPLLAGRISDRYGERVPVMIGFLMSFMAFLVFLQAEGYAVFALSWIIFGIGGGMFGPAYQSLISKTVPSKMMGIFNGVFYSSLGFFSLPAPWLGAQLWERLGPQSPFLITSVASLVVLPLLWLKFRVPAQRHSEQTEPAVEDPASALAAIET